MTAGAKIAAAIAGAIALAWYVAIRDFGKSDLAKNDARKTLPPAPTDRAISYQAGADPSGKSLGVWWIFDRGPDLVWDHDLTPAEQTRAGLIYADAINRSRNATRAQILDLIHSYGDA
jgi:hypothetical protein